eukprot:10043008-Prorocentrum_lima.AAC.1
MALYETWYNAPPFACRMQFSPQLSWKDSSSTIGSASDLMPPKMIFRATVRASCLNSAGGSVVRRV